MNFVDELVGKIDESQILKNVKIADYTSFKIGGIAKYLVNVSSIDDIINVVELSDKYSQKYFILGKGSNLLFSDGVYNGVVIRLSSDFSDIKIVENECSIIAQAGASLKKLAEFAYERSLSGLEFAHGIPGSVGGASYMNAGAYGSEMKNVVKEILVLNKNMQIETIETKDLAYGYRKSAMQKREDIILLVKFELQKGEKTNIKSLMDDLYEKRVSKQPLEYPSAGSVFKRPEGYFAGKLIQDSNLAGYCIGDACVSEKHCGFIINKGNATAQNIIDLIVHIKKVVYENFGVELERELKIVDMD